MYLDFLTESASTVPRRYNTPIIEKLMIIGNGFKSGPVTELGIISHFSGVIVSIT
jgi:hypothetical protein